MSEQLAPASPVVEHLQVPQQKEVLGITAQVEERPDVASDAWGMTAAQEDEAKTAAIEGAQFGIKEALKKQGIEDVASVLDFSADKFDFFAVDSYQAQAATQAEAGGRNTRREGAGELSEPEYYGEGSGKSNENKWGDPRQEAHNSGKPVEKVGIQAGPTEVWTTVEKKVPAPGLRGKLGFKTTQQVPELKTVEQTFRFDYEFAAPSHSDDEAALDAGNRAGQNIRLSLDITREQAADLSGILKNNPKAARILLDKFVSATNGNGMWEADVYDDEGNFQDPGKRYGTDYVARDVRPRYEAVPDLEPEIIGLIER